MSDAITNALFDSGQAQRILELQLPGETKYYAEETFSIGDKLHNGKITAFPDVGASFDLSGPRYSISGIQFKVMNDERLQDKEKLSRLDGSIGTVRLWAPGLTWAQIETDAVLFRGTFKKLQHDRMTYSFELQPMIDSKMKMLTGYTYNTDAFTSLKLSHSAAGLTGSQSGNVIPLIFGDFDRGIPLTCVIPWTGAVAQYVIGIGPSKSVDADYGVTKNLYSYGDVAHALGNYIFYPNVSSPSTHGIPLICVNFSADPTTSEPNHAGVQGIYDEDGYLIEHPVDIMTYLLENYSFIDHSYIDYASFGTMKQILGGLKFAVYVNDSVDGGQILMRIASQCMCAVGDLGIGPSVVTFDVNAPSVGTIDADKQVLTELPAIRSTDSSLIVNNLLCQYDMNYNTSRFEGIFRKNYTNDPSLKDSYYEYGELPEAEVAFPDIQLKDVAVEMVNRFIAMRAKQHDLLEMVVSWSTGWKYQLGDVAEITCEDGPSGDGEGWVDERMILIEKHYTAEGIRQLWWRIDTN